MFCKLFSTWVQSKKSIAHHNPVPSRHISKRYLVKQTFYKIIQTKIIHGYDYIQHILFLKVLVYSIREGNGNPLQYSCLENAMDGGTWQATVHGVAKSWTRLSDFTFTFHFHALEKEMATHSSILAWRSPGAEEPGGLPSMGSQRVRHDWNDLAAVYSILLHWKKRANFDSLN